MITIIFLALYLVGCAAAYGNSMAEDYNRFPMLIDPIAGATAWPSLYSMEFEEEWKRCLNRRENTLHMCMSLAFLSWIGYFVVRSTSKGDSKWREFRFLLPPLPTKEATIKVANERLSKILTDQANGISPK